MVLENRAGHFPMLFFANPKWISKTKPLGTEAGKTDCHNTNSPQKTCLDKRNTTTSNAQRGGRPHEYEDANYPCPPPPPGPPTNS